jgi:hypothetical protein
MADTNDLLQRLDTAARDRQRTHSGARALHSEAARKIRELRAEVIRLRDSRTEATSG